MSVVDGEVTVTDAPKRKKKSSIDTEVSVVDGEVTVTEDAEISSNSDEVEMNNEPSDDGVEATEEFIIPRGEVSFDDGEDEPELDILGDPIGEECEEPRLNEAAAPLEYSPAPLSKKEPKYDPESPRRVDFLFDFLELFVFTLVAVLVITTFFVRHSVVDGSSMEDGLHDGDVLVISNLFYTPTNNDIVVIQDTTTALKKPIVKRVIAVGGQVVRVAREGIYINGEYLEEDYVYTDNLEYTYHTMPCEELTKNPGFRIQFEEIDGRRVISYYEFSVPDGELFVMGDHRNVSTDSRAIGTVRVDAVLGRVIFRLFPFDAFGTVE